MSIEPVAGIESYTTVLATQRASEVEDLSQAQQAARADQIARTEEIAQAQAALAATRSDGAASLTAGDRDFLGFLYGPDVLNTLGINGQSGSETPQFLLDVLNDRQTGVLPAGTEITSSYIEARYDAYLSATGAYAVSNPLTATDLEIAQDYFDRRSAGAAVDLPL